MRFRFGLMLGMGAGYVLGAKAGQQRYEEIRERFNSLMETQQAQQLQSQVREAAQRTGSLLEEKAADGVAKVTQKVGGGSSTAGNNTDNADAADPADLGIVLPPT